MLDKIKSWVSAAKDFLIWIITPIAVVAGYIFYILNQNSTLKDELKQSQASEKLKEDKDAQTKEDVQGDKSSADYEQLRDEYLKEHKDEN